MDTAGRHRLRRWWGSGVSIVVTALVALPLALPTTSDSFPLSTYPMFSRQLPATVSLPHVLAVDANGSRRPLPPAALGTDEVIGASVMIRAAVRGGPEMLDELCRRAAQHSSAAGSEAVVVVTATYDVVAYFTEGRTPLDSYEHIRCRP